MMLRQFLLVMLVFVLSLPTAYAQTEEDSLLQVAISQKASGDIKSYAKTEYRLGQLYYYDYQDSLSMLHLFNAKDAGRQVGNREVEAKSNNSIGNLLSVQGRHEEACKHYQEAIEIAEAMGNDTIRASFCSNLGSELQSLGKYEEATEMLYDALELKERIGASKKSISSTLLNIGLIWDGLGSVDEALTFYNRSLDLKRELNDSIGISRVLSNIAVIHKNREDYEVALNLIHESNRFNVTEQNPKQFYVNYTNIGNIAKRLGDEEKAIRYLDSAYMYADQMDNQEFLSDVTQNLGALYHEKGDYEKALFYLKRAVSLAGEDMTVVLRYELHRSLANAYSSQGFNDSAFKHLTISNRFRDSIFKIEGQKSMQDIREKYETEKKDKELAEQEVLLQTGRVRTLVIAIIAICVFCLAVGVYIYQRAKRARERALAQERIAQEKNRISKELHDNIGSRLTYIISSLENTRLSKDQIPPDSVARLSSFGRETISDLRNTVWAMKQDHGTVETLIQRVRELKNTVHDVVSIEVHNRGDLSFTLTATELLSIFRIVQEFVQNSIKYSKDKEVVIDFSVSSNQAKVRLVDKGAGYEPDSINVGNGVLNMQKRAEAIEAEYRYLTKTTEGVVLELNLIRH